MSKMDGLRAMREARYAEAQARANGAPAKKKVATAPRKPAATSPVEHAAESAAPAEDGVCGHRNMGGRTCTREQGHAAKSHRYS